MTIAPARPAVTRILSIAAALGLLTGCATRGDYPSLAPRVAEDAAQAGAADAGAPPVPVDAALDAQVAALLAQATAGHAAFDKAAGQACSAIARGTGAAQGTEPWIAAQQAISAVDAARAPVLSAAAELDRLVIERGTATGPAVDLTRLAAAQERTSAMDAAEQARIAALPTGKCAG